METENIKIRRKQKTWKQAVIKNIEISYKQKTWREIRKRKNSQKNLSKEFKNTHEKEKEAAAA